MIDLNSIPKIKDDVVTRKIADELLVVPIHHTARDVDSIYTLNETAAFIWESLDGTTSLSSVADSVAATFAVTREDASTDVLSLVADLENLGMITY